MQLFYVTLLTKCNNLRETSAACKGTAWKALAMIAQHLHRRMGDLSGEAEGEAE
jgi:hypothetical protein